MAQTSHPADIQFQSVIPILRIFDIAKAREFYIEFLGFSVDWENRIVPEGPLYMQVSRGPLKLHLSEHHGDGTPGSAVFVLVRNLMSLHRELTEKAYKYNRPGLERMPWGAQQVSVIDPFHNELHFNEFDEVAA
jgi:extradiol dioxygenase family protein